MKRIAIFTLILSIVILGSARADDDLFDRFKQAYGLVDLSLEGSPGEVADISNFVYKKDVAEFKFDSGRLHLLRFIEGRPTAAIFIGHGSAHIDVPVPSERQSLRAISGDSTINQQFEVCFIRMSDDFDLKLKEKFTFEDEHLNWRDFISAAKGENQGELFFKPSIAHQYDNYFQLLRSHFERAPDGYFWIDFNRYNFCFDPNRPQQVHISYEFEGGDAVATEAAVFQRKELDRYKDSDLSHLDYPTTPISVSGKLEMGGLDGRSINNSMGHLQMVVNADSIRFVSLFLHFNLKIDSMHYGVMTAGYWRRKDFRFIGVVLPHYRYKGDTLDFTLWYKGNNFDTPFPSVEDPTPIPYNFDVVFPKGYNYIITDRGTTEPYDNKNEMCGVVTKRPYHQIYFQGYASGYDTITVETTTGMSFNFLKSQHIKKGQSCFVPDETYQKAALDAFNFYTSRSGAPTGTFAEYVYPEGYLLTAPGLIKLPQIACVTEGTMEAIGGFNALAGWSVARQWYGAAVQPVSGRERWLDDALPEYMMLMYLEDELQGSEFYSNLLFKRDSVYRISERGRDVPLSCGIRETEDISYKSIYANKGPWLFHMLRFLMFDLESHSDKNFQKFLYELIYTANNSRFSNTDVQRIAEKYYGQSLDRFFEEWLYGYGYPEFNVEYSFKNRAGQYFVEAEITTDKVPESFGMPVLFRVAAPDGNHFYRENIGWGKQTVTLGPLDVEPTEMFFNEFFSVLSKDNVKKK